MPTAGVVLAEDLAEHGWRLAPDRLAAHITRFEPVTEGFGGEFQMSGPYQRPRHVRKIGAVLADTISEGNGRLIVNQPPQTGKSMLISRWTPTWAHHLTEGKVRVLLGSYQARYAASWGKATKDTVEKFGDELLLELSPFAHARDVWETTAGGGMRTSGIEGSMTGLPGDIIIVDDPFRSFKEAHSPTVRQDVWDWFWAVPMTRLQPGSTVIVVQTRWHEDDLTGRLMSSEGAHRWTQLRIPALCDDPATDFLGRKLGESIWPERFSEEHYSDLKIDSGAYKWAGMYQQLPAPLEGEIFKRAKWVKVDAAPIGRMTHLVRRWDLASTQDDGDYTAGVLMGRTDRSEFFILDIQHERLSSLGVEELIKDTARRDHKDYGGKVLIRLEQEPGATGKRTAEDYVKRLLSGYPAKALRTDNKKELKAQPFAAQQEAENVMLVRHLDKITGQFVTPTWWEEFIEEAAVFPSGTHDDMVDAASEAFNDLRELEMKRVKAKTRTMAGERIGVPPQTGQPRGQTRPPG
jgi:predicted phage terminase large subunit-like protein